MGLLRELFRRWRLYQQLPRHWRWRPDTIDRTLLRHVLLENEYQLPRRFASDDVLLDVGGHIGSFTLAVLRRGAGRVVCYEPDSDNFQLLTHNLAPFGSQVELHQAAVWHERPAVPLALHNPLQARNTGANQLCRATARQGVPVVVFDELIDRLTVHRRLRLVKLDCEGAEWPLLLTSRRLDRIEQLCGEYHLGSLSEVFAVPGVPSFSTDLLAEHLRQQGFEVRLYPHERAAIASGLFFATRLSRKPAERTLADRIAFAPICSC